MGEQVMKDFCAAALVLQKHQIDKANTRHLLTYELRSRHKKKKDQKFA